MVEKYLQMYLHTHGLEHAILTLFVLMVLCQSPHRPQSARTVFTYQALRNEKITIWGDGEISCDDLTSRI